MEKDKEIIMDDEIKILLEKYKKLKEIAKTLRTTEENVLNTIKRFLRDLNRI